MAERPIRVILADDHAIVLEGLRQFFLSHEGFEVLACCRTADEALTSVRTTDADVLVLDLRMPDHSGLDVLRVMVNEARRCRAVLLTASISDDDAVEALRLGAMGLVLKESSPDDLIVCVQHVYRGEQWIDRKTLGRAFGRVSKRESAASEISKALSPREVEIVRLLAEGLKNREIADRLHIAEGTVKVHLYHVYDKLDVEGRLELLLYAQQKGLV
jgi:two-component system nitrate/nitrite response regulator NarL